MVDIDALKFSTARIEADMARTMKLHFNMVGYTRHPMDVADARATVDMELGSQPPVPCISISVEATSHTGIWVKVNAGIPFRRGARGDGGYCVPLLSRSNLDSESLNF